MATSETEIVNAAVRLVAGKRIASLTEGKKNDNVARDLYKFARDELLASHTWRFATRTASLAPLTAAPAMQYDHAYALPDDWLRTISVHPDDSGRTRVAFEEMELDGQGVIASSADEVWLKYVYALEDVNRMSALFRQALILSLARDLAIPIANSNTLHDKLDVRAIRMATKAKSQDSLGSPSRQRPRGSWAQSRGNSRYGYQSGSGWG